MIFDGVAQCIINSKNDLTVSLIATQCLQQLADKLPKDNSISKESIEPILLQLIELLKVTNEDTLNFPIDCIISLSTLNKEAALIVPFKASNDIIKLYSEYYNHPTLGIKLLQLIRLCCEDDRSSKLMIQLFIPFSIYVFGDFFKSLSGSNKGFDEVKNIVMTEHGGGNLDIKTNIDMLPVIIFFI